MTKILLVEDDKSLREIYGVRLLAEGYDIVSAGDGEEALAMAIKERPQLIVSDVMMPKISGFDMLDILRSTSETKDIKVIMMTALSSEDQRARGESLGADRYLVKSQVGIEDVVRTVHDVLADSLAPAVSPASVFGAPAPSAVARPATPAVPVVSPVTPDPYPTAAIPPAAAMSAAPAVAAPLAAAAPALTPAPAVPTPPVINMPAPAPITPTEAPMPATNPFLAPNPGLQPLPQPIAPFSSDRPPTLGDRVIHPLADQPAVVDMGNLINQELSASVAPMDPTPPLPPSAPMTPPLPPQA